MLTEYSFDKTKNKLDFYRVKDCTKWFCKDLKGRAAEIISYEKKKEMIPLTYEENESYRKQKVCYVCKKEFITDKDDKNAIKLYHK